jgi:hypothetical protein
MRRIRSASMSTSADAGEHAHAAKIHASVRAAMRGEERDMRMAGLFE